MNGINPDWAEREYNPRLLVPDAARITAAWSERAAAARARHPATAEFRYGDHPREVLDLFRAREPRGAVLFIHGGYWRAFSKNDFSWVAESFLDSGVSIAILNYPLCPDVTLARIVRAARRAFVMLYGQILSPAECERFVVTGHSAGGYLAAMHLATDWEAFGLPRDPIAGVVPISGVFELAPLIETSINEAIRLDSAEAKALSLLGSHRSGAALTLVVGGGESAEFHRQSEALGARWAHLAPRIIDVPGRNHFDVIDGLADASSGLHQAITGMIAGAALSGSGAD